MGTPLRVDLEELYVRYHRLENLYPDPLVYARGYDDPGEGEVAGLLAASLAYGRVDKILDTLASVFRNLEEGPRSVVLRSAPSDMEALTKTFRYRFHKNKDLALFLWLLRQALERWGSLLHLFQAVDPGGDIGCALKGFTDALLSGDPRPLLRTRAIPPAHPVRHFLPSPARGGAAKRLCLYLRWMVRKDDLDPGYWSGAVESRRLVIPLDTHVAQVARSLGLSARQTADWKMACEITEVLRQYDPADPVRYDFSLFRFGMGGGVLSV